MGGLRYLSVCSGIEAASMAWEPLGWRPQAFSEIAPFPCAVLAHHWPHVPNWGDVTNHRDWPDAAFDLLVGGTPCQDFSVAGPRAGLAGGRGQLTLAFLEVARRYRPEWLVWENVPGALSLNGGRDFGAVLGRLAELGYGFAYRILDAQFFGLAQRRKRVFVVGHLGDWRAAAAVLFERSSLSWGPKPRRKASTEVAGVLGCGASRGGGWRIGGDEAAAGHLVAHTLHAHHTARLDPSTDTLVAHTLRAEGFDASEDGTGRGTPLVPVPIGDCRGAREGIRSGIGIGKPGDPAYALTADGKQAIAYDLTQITHPENRANPKPGDPTPTLPCTGHPLAVAFEAYQDPTFYGTTAGPLLATDQPMAVMTRYVVRRITPREAERLQGFPDDFTLVPYRRGRLAADGPRYRAIGNSMAVPVMAWIGQRIDRVRSLLRVARERAA